MEAEAYFRRGAVLDQAKSVGYHFAFAERFGESLFQIVEYGDFRAAFVYFGKEFQLRSSGQQHRACRGKGGLASYYRGTAVVRKYVVPGTRRVQ